MSRRRGPCPLRCSHLLSPLHPPGLCGGRGSSPAPPPAESTLGPLPVPGGLACGALQPGARPGPGEAAGGELSGAAVLKSAASEPREGCGRRLVLKPPPRRQADLREGLGVFPSSLASGCGPCFCAEGQVEAAWCCTCAVEARAPQPPLVCPRWRPQPPGPLLGQKGLVASSGGATDPLGRGAGQGPQSRT